MDENPGTHRLRFMHEADRRFDRLAGPHRPGLLRLARRCEPDPARAEDLLQQALLVAWRKRDQLRAPEAARAWLARILLTTWLDRRRTREVPVARLPDVEAGPRPDEVVAARRLGDRLVDAMGALPEEQRLAVWLVDGEGFTFAEAAEALAAPPGTVASRVARGRAALRDALRDLAAERGIA